MIRTRGLAIVLGVSLGVLVLTQTVFLSFGFAAQRHVPGDYPTIQDALNAADPGDQVVLQGGTYHEDITIDTPGIQLVPAFGEQAVLDGNITVTAAAGGTVITRIEMPEGKTIVVEDGIQWPASFPTGTENRVVTLAGGDNSYDVTMGDVKADVSLGSVAGVYFYADGHGSTFTHTGTIEVKNTAVSSSARGASVLTGDGGHATIERVDVEAENLAIGLHFFTGDAGQLTINDDVLSRAWDDGSTASGIGIRGQTGVTAALGDAELGVDVDVEVEGGDHAVGVDFNVGDGGVLTHSGDIDVKARDDNSAAYGVMLGAGDGSSATIGKVTVEGDRLAHGVTTTYPSGASIVTDGLKSNAGVHITGDLHVTARDGDSQAYGVDLHGENDLTLTVGNIQVEGGQLARGVWLRTGDGGNLTHVGNLSARSLGGSAHGILVEAGGSFQARVENVHVQGDGDAVQGVALNVGDGGQVSHEGLIEVTGTSSAAVVRGVNVMAGESFSATIGDVTVEGPESALGFYWTSTDGASLTHTGTIRATTTDTGGDAGGATIMAGDELFVSVGDVEAVARGSNSSATGFYGGAGHEFQGSFGFLTVEGTALARGLMLSVGDGATIEVDAMSAVASDTGSQAYGAFINAQENLVATFGNITATGGGFASGISLATTADGGSLTQKGEVAVTARGATSDADGINVAAQNDFSVAVEDIVTVSASGMARGVSYRVGDGGSFAIDGDVTATSATGAATGVIVGAGDNFEATIGNVAADGVSDAQGVSVQVGNGGTLTQTGTIHAGATGDNASIRGMTMTVGDDFTMTLDNVEVTSAGDGSSALGVFGTAGDDFSANVGDVTVAAKRTTWGVSLRAGDGAAIHVDSVETVSDGADSDAYGVQFTAEDDLNVTVGEVVSRADRAVWAATIRADGALALDVDTVSAEAGTFAYGVIVESGSSTVTVRGDVSAETMGGTGIAQGLTVQGAVADVTNDGRVYASANNAVGVGLGSSAAAERIAFRNRGTVETSGHTGSAVMVNVTEAATVLNEGAIHAGSGVAFSGTNSTGSISLANTGTMVGNVLMGQGGDTLSVSEAGRIVGQVNMGAGADRLVLERGASIEGNVSLGVGDDEATVHYGAILAGMLDGGAGDDTLTLLGEGASSPPAGWTWNGLSARQIEQTWVHGGAWQLGAGTSLGAVDVDDAYIRIDDAVAIADLRLHDGALVGDGNVTGTVVNDGGVVAPGNSFGILTITGDYTQGPDGVLYIELDATAAPNAGANYDQLVIVGGTATFQDGTTVRVQPILGATLPDRAEYVIVDGDVIFDPGAVHLDIDLPRRLFYGGWLEEGSMKLVLGVTPFDAVAETENQKAVGEALTQAKGLPDTDLDDLYDWLGGLDPDQADEARAAYDSLSGEVYSHLPTLASRRLDGFVSAIGRGLVDPEVEPKGKVWAVPYGDFGEVRAGPGTAASRFRLAGAAAGVDLLAGPTSRIGLSVGAGSNRFTMDDRASEVWGHGHQLGLYGHFTVGKARLTALLGYGRSTHHSRRTVQFGDVKRRAEARFRTTDRVAWMEARFPSSRHTGMRIEPVASLGHFHTRHGSFTEKGAGTTGLTVDGRDVRWLRGRLGIELTGGALALGSGTVSPRASLAWVNDFSPVERIHRGRLQGATGTPFTIHGTKAHRSGFEASLGLKGEGRRGFAWSFGYTGEFRRDMRSHMVMGRVSFGF